MPVHPNTSTPFTNEQVSTEQIAHVLRQGSLGALANIALAIAYAGINWALLDHASMVAWGAAVALVSLARAWLARRAARHPLDPLMRHGRALALIMGALTGLSWGVAAWWLLPFDPLNVNFILTMMLIAVWAGALGSFGAWYPSFAVYLAAAMGPPLGWLLAWGDGQMRAAAIGGVIFAGFLIRVSREITVMFCEAVRQRHELERMTQSLSTALDAAESANRAKSSFLVNMNHEIRTPLNAVVGLSELLLQSVRQPKNIEYVRVMREASLSLLSIINNVLDLSRIEAGQLDIHREPFDLHALVPRVVSMFRPEADRKGLGLSADIDATVPRLLVADANRIRQIIVNLVGNALKFTDEGEVRIRVLRVVPGAGRAADICQLRVEVSDTGPGLDAAAVKMLFRPFTQVDASSTRSHGGAGLGLSISAQLARLMGGDIGVESEPGKGSTFWFTVPTEIGEAVAMPTPVGHHAQRPADARPRLLLVEDNDVNMFVTSHALRQLNCEVVCAASGREALSLLEAGKFDLVLMDCQMREMDGYEATRQWRQRERESGRMRTPIVALTANAMAGDRETCIAVGMDDYLTKPVRRRDLRDLLAQFAGTTFTRLDAVNDPVNHAVTGAPGPTPALPAAASNDEVAIEGDPAVDEEIFDSLRSDLADGHARLVRIVDLYRQQGDKLIEALRSGSTANDVDALRQAAHSFKSGSASLGAMRLAALCGELERQCRIGSLARADVQVAVIAGEYDRVCGHLARLVPGSAPG